MDSFGARTRDLLIEENIVTAIGNPNWSHLALGLEGIGYESLRKAVAGERHPSKKIMQAVADYFGVEPDVFTEYQLIRAQEAFDPNEVGEDKALENLAVWSAAQSLRKS